MKINKMMGVFELKQVADVRCGGQGDAGSELSG